MQWHQPPCAAFFSSLRFNVGCWMFNVRVTSPHRPLPIQNPKLKIQNSILPPAMPVRAAPIFSKLADAHSAFKIQNLILPPARQTARLHLSAPADELLLNLETGGRHRPRRCRQTDPKGQGSGGACPGGLFGDDYPFLRLFPRPLIRRAFTNPAISATGHRVPPGPVP